MDDEALVRIENLSFSYAGTQIYRSVSLEIPRGGITALLGPSGTGKTTLLRLIGGQLRADSGSITFEGEELTGIRRARLYELRKKMSMLFQSGALFTDLTVFDNVAFPLREHTRLPDVLIRDLVLMKLEAVGLRAAAGLYPQELSGGMARRAALARAIALDPLLIMYDEPFVGQDPITMSVLIKLICDLNANLGLTSIIVTHDVQEVLDIAHKVYILHQGQVLGSGSPAAIRSSSDARIRQFINGEFDGPFAFNLHAQTDYFMEL